MQFPIQHVAALTVVRATELAEDWRKPADEKSRISVSCSASEHCKASLHNQDRMASLLELMKPAIRRVEMGVSSDGILWGKRGQHELKGQSRNLRGTASGAKRSCMAKECITLRSVSVR